MKKIITIFASFAVVLSALSFNASPAYACSCMAPKPPAEALADSAYVFKGKVSSVVSDDNGYKVSFATEQVWKGEYKESLEVSTAQDSAGCGFAFDKDKTYVVYAYSNDDGSLATGLCSRTHEYVEGEQEAAQLGVVTAPPVDTSSGPNSSYPFRPLVLAIGTIIVLAAAFVLARKKVSP